MFRIILEEFSSLDPAGEPLRSHQDEVDGSDELAGALCRALCRALAAVELEPLPVVVECIHHLRECGSPTGIPVQGMQRLTLNRLYAALRSANGLGHATLNGMATVTASDASSVTVPTGSNGSED